MSSQTPSFSNPTPAPQEQESPSSSPNSPTDQTTPLPPFDWQDLETRFQHRMHEFKTAEEAIYDEFNDCMKIFENWAATSTVYENERAFKRLKTRTSFVQMSEERLEEKRLHYTKVVAAFQSALALLGSA